MGELKPLVGEVPREALVVYEGVTDADGDAGGTTLKCSAIGSASAYPDFDGNQIILTSGSYSGQARDINGATNGDAAGTITVANAFDGQIASGTSFIITGIRTTPAEVAALQADVGDASASSLGSLYAILGNLPIPAYNILGAIDFYGKVTTYTDTTHFKASALAGLGDDFFNGYWIYVVRDAGGLGAAPQGELQPVSDYVSSDGTFTHSAFSVALAVDDEIILVNPRFADLQYLVNKAVTGAGVAESIANKLDLGAGYKPASDQYYTATRAGYLDNINNAQLLNVPDLSTLTATRIGYLDFLNSDSKYLISTALSGTELANSIGRLIYELGVNRLTETRAGYLDEAISAAKTLTADTITSIRQSVCADTDPASSIGKLLYDNLNAPVGSIPTNPTLQTVWTDARAGYLDNLNIGETVPTQAQINAQVDTALADINLDHLIQTSGAVSDAAPAAGDFDTNLAEETNDHYNDLIITFTSGALAGQSRRISDYDGTSKNIIVTPAFTEAPADGDAFVIISGSYLKGVTERLDTQAKTDVRTEVDAEFTERGATSARFGYLDNINQAGLLDVTAARAGYLDILNSDSKYILSTALTAPTVNSLARFIASGGTALGTPLPDSKSLYDVIALDRLDNATYGLSALNTDLDSILADVGDASTSTLGSLYAILGNPTQDFLTMLGYEGSTSLAAKLTAARAGYLDILNSDSKYLISNALPGTEVADSIADKIKSIKTETDKIPGGEYLGTASAGTSAETTIYEIVTTKRIEIKSIWLDLVNLTADATIKVYHKIDGTNYRQYDTYSWTTSDEDGVLITGCTINNDWKITITGGEGAGVSIPYNIIYEVMES